MEAVAITHKGFEDICSKEIKELLQKETKIDNRFIEFEIDDIKELLKLYYTSQSIEFAFLKLSEGKTIEEAKEKINESIVQWIDDETNLIVRCEREVEIQDIPEVEASVADKIIQITGAKVNFKQPELRIITYVTENKTIIGIDFALIDLSKRQHKNYKSNISIKGTLAFCLYKLAENPKTALDPFCGSGEIIIEAALYESKKPVNFFQKDALAFTSNPKLEDLNLESFFSNIDKKETKSSVRLIATNPQLKFIKSVKSNAKIAGVNQSIEIARMDIEWLDTKFDKESISHIITQPPELSKNKSEPQIRKILNELFHQAEFILTKDGKLIAINRSSALLKEIAKNNKFKIIEERKVSSGKQEYDVVILGK
ncbi:hypothetical protein KY345_02055 [Candidatus Woesearchaeota archaeon]|nr:hypothetical protein [Candidatus Woesearchaeota archaeon]